MRDCSGAVGKRVRDCSGRHDELFKTMASFESGVIYLAI